MPGYIKAALVEK